MPTLWSMRTTATELRAPARRRTAPSSRAVVHAWDLGLLLGANVVLVVGLGVTAAVALGSSSSHSYRTATVTRGMVAQQLPGTGTIQPVSQASIAFPIAGVVSSVAVKTGDQVITGPYNSVRGMADGDVVKVDNNKKK